MISSTSSVDPSITSSAPEKRRRNCDSASGNGAASACASKTIASGTT